MEKFNFDKAEMNTRKINEIKESFAFHIMKSCNQYNDKYKMYMIKNSYLSLKDGICFIDDKREKLQIPISMWLDLFEENKGEIWYKHDVPVINTFRETYLLDINLNMKTLKEIYIENIDKSISIINKWDIAEFRKPELQTEYGTVPALHCSDINVRRLGNLLFIVRKEDVLYQYICPFGGDTLNYQFINNGVYYKLDAFGRLQIIGENKNDK